MVMFPTSTAQRNQLVPEVDQVFATQPVHLRRNIPQRIVLLMLVRCLLKLQVTFSCNEVCGAIITLPRSS